MNKYEQEKLQEIKQIVATIAYKVAVPLYLLFWLLDLIYVPQYKWEFLGLRCLIVPGALLIHRWLQYADTFQDAERVGLFLAFMCAAILNIMIFVIGEGALYSINLQLVAIGGLSFIPWSGRYFGLAALLIYGPYLAIETTHLDQAGYYMHLAVNTFFIIGVITITWVYKTLREKMRQRELSIRNDLELEIKKRKQTEQDLIIARDQALAATRAKESFLANMSHEIRTPLTAIMGYADTALDDDQTAEQRVTALKTIRRSGDHLLGLINDILDFSKVEAGELQIEKLPINPLQQVAEVESIMTGLAAGKGLEFGVEYVFPLPKKIHSDPIRIKQVLLNLCSNAIKFTDRGSVRLVVRYDPNHRRLTFQVKDSGIGMSPEQLDMIFKPFKQADSSTARRFGGTGLGLSLSKNLANLLGGELSVQSAVDKGSIFDFTLELDTEDEETLFTSMDDLTGGIELDKPGTSIKLLSGEILLVEDNIINQQLITMYLKKMGANVTCAENGEVAVRLAQQHDYDLVYMDMQMPVMPGVEAVRQLRENGYTVPIIMLTANATPEDKTQCLQAGANDFVTKPIVRQTLYEVTARYLKPAEKAGSDANAIFSTLLQNDPELAAVLHQYFHYLKKFQRQIIESYKTGDLAKFHRVVHDLKGTAGSYGYPQLTHLATEIETHSKQQDQQSVSKLLDQLNEMCERIYAGLNETIIKAG